MPETKVALRHLLDDMRDNYPFPIEEAILTELIANSLDSQCSRVEIQIEPRERRLTFVDNGNGMTRKEFKQYHDIAATTKSRGRGIGFAGLGAKLALLICDEVLSETRQGPRQLATRWRLASQSYAPWDWRDPSRLVTSTNGTAVRLVFHKGQGDFLLSAQKVRAAIRSHFYPLLDRQFDRIIRMLYPDGVGIFIDGEPVVLPEVEKTGVEYFLVQGGKRKKWMGRGVLLKTSQELPEGQWGLAISTYGKVIKHGWDWLRVTPKNPGLLTGVVEVPELVECLTTNKCDFLGDSRSLQKYYSVRKVIQNTVGGLLEKLGESRRAEAKPDRALEKLQKEINKVVGEILPDFPELAPLFGRKQRGAEVPVHVADPYGQIQATEAAGTDITTGDIGGAGTGEGIEGAAEGPLDGAHLEAEEVGRAQATGHLARRKRPGLMITFDDGGEEIGWLQSSKLVINQLHPGWKRAQRNGEEQLYIIFSAASVLSAHVQEKRAPLEFVQQFLSAWGAMR